MYSQGFENQVQSFVLVSMPRVSTQAIKTPHNQSVQSPDPLY
ncbi:MAG: hypothetical protein VSS75_026895 [Candidatus Parabeggiatoa sp.]|nr:hypothetical protein [Candidatus Parabeggiatoa sp.]